MIGLKSIAFAAVACIAMGLVAAPAGADDRHDRRGGHEYRSERGHDGGKRYEKAYRYGRRDGYREARRDEWRDYDYRRYDEDRRFGRDFSRDRGLKRGWRVGERPPRDRVVVIRDHRERRYPRPPRDAYYVSIDRDVFLVAAATGVIIDVLRRD